MVSFVDVVKGQAVSLANLGYKKITGQLAGVVGSALNRAQPTDNPSQKPKLEPKMFTFPLDVDRGDQGLGNHGHYIIFYIRAYTHAKIQFGRKDGNSKGEFSMREAAAQHGGVKADHLNYDLIKPAWAGGPGSLKKAGEIGFTPQQLAAHPMPENDSVEFLARRTSRNRRPPTVRLDTAIALYMPPTVSVTYTANYTDTPIGSGAARGLDIIKAISEGGAAAGLKMFISPESVRDAADLFTKLGLGTAGAIPGFQGARELYEMNQGYIMTNRMELAFKGTSKRGFQYTFKMIPKSEQEANEVKGIVSAFKENMLPEGDDVGSTGLGFTGKNFKIPNTFNIEYMFVNQENSYLNKISECVLETMNVTYGGDRYKTFDANVEGAQGAPPVETTITLNFKELDLITKEKAKDGL